MLWASCFQVPGRKQLLLEAEEVQDTVHTPRPFAAWESQATNMHRASASHQVLAEGSKHSHCIQIPTVHLGEVEISILLRRTHISLAYSPCV